MPLSSDTSAALSLLERIQRAMKENDDAKLSDQCNNDLNTLISVLESPVFRGIVNIQESLKELKKQVSQHPSIVPADFDITREGKLVLHVSPEFAVACEAATLPLNSSIMVQREEELRDAEPSICSEKIELQEMGQGKEVSDGSHDGDEMPPSITNATLDEELQRAIQAAAQGRDIHHIQLYKPDGSSLGFSVVGLRSEKRGELGIYVQGIQATGIAAQDGRLEEGDQILAIDGQVLDSYISHQQAIGILQKATRLVDLVVARAPPLEKQHQSLASLEQDQPLQKHEKQPSSASVTAQPQEPNATDMLNTEWAQVEVIDLINDGSGLGFGIIGGRSTGVVVKTILPGGVADRDSRLRSGDHILQIGDVNLRGMGSDQVAAVLRQSGSHVRLIVARPVEPTSPDFQVGRSAPIVETRVLNDPEELERHLSLLHNGYPPTTTADPVVAASGSPATNGHIAPYTNGDTDALTRESLVGGGVGEVSTVTTEAHLHYPEVQVEGEGGSSASSLSPPGPVAEAQLQQQPAQAGALEGESAIHTYTEDDLALVEGALPEMETIDVEVTKDHQGLGITIAGYVCEREELSGIFVKSINMGSAADRNGQIQVNDQIVQVDGRSLAGLSNHAAVDVLRATGQVVRLRLARYLRGPKYEQLQQAIANSELKTTPTTPNPPRAQMGELPSSEAIRTALGDLEMNVEDPVMVEAINPALSAPTSSSTIIADVPTFSTISNQPPQPPVLSSGMNSSYATTTNVPQLSSTIPQLSSGVPPLSSGTSTDIRLEDIELMIDSNYSGELRPSVENAIKRKWSRIVGPEFEIVVAQLSKFEEGGGLGISLEGTVDVEGGREVRPHHYIRSILPDGPVGKNGRLCSGDELLEVNGQKLLGLNHVEVVGILKELPGSVRLVCGRRAPGAPPPLHPIDAPTADRDTFAARNILGGSLQNLIPGSERLVKAKSDGSLASSATAATNDTSFNRMKSRSLEPLTGLAMWSSEAQIIELMKGDRGLGFSILDYQDPLNPQETVIVIRSLVPGGVAEKDGRLIPGDRLIAVNGTNLENATLDQAVAALKGAPKGPVSIAVAKPISVLESTGQAQTPDSDDPTASHPRRNLLDAILGEFGASGDGDLHDNQLLDKTDGGDEEDDEERGEEEDRDDEEDLDDHMYRGHRHSGSILSSTGSEVPPLPLSSPPHTPAFPTDEEEEITEYDNELKCGAPEDKEGTSASKEPPDLTLSLASPSSLQPPCSHDPAEVVSPVSVYKASVLMVPVATERLIGSGPTNMAAAPSTTSLPAAQPPSQTHAAYAHGTGGGAGSGDEDQTTPHSSPQLSRWAAQVPPLPKEMERTIKIKKGADQLGVNIEVVDQGVNGVVVSSLVRNGAVHKDGRLHAGDFILSVNNESMRNITNSQARAILRRTQLVSTDVSICYIRGQDAAAFREASLLQYRSGQQEQHQQSQQSQQQTSPRIFPKYYRSPYVPRGDSSEDETAGGINSDLTRSITAPSFITRDLRSRDPSHEDLLGSISSLPQQPETEVGGLTVINIKHALSETLAETRAEESNISSVHIGGEENKNIEEDSEEGPFTITFKNVSEAHPEYNPKVGLEPEAEDHEVLGVLQGDGVSSGRPPGGEPCLYTNPECITNIHILTGTSEPSVTNQFIVNNRIGNNLAGTESDFQTPDSLELTSGAPANLYQQSSSRLVRFAESKGRSEHSESSDSSAERSSSLFVECDSDRHSVSDVLSDDLNTPSAKLVVAHLTDVESVVQKRSIVTSRSFDESPHIQKSYFERQYSEVILDSSYLAREQVITQEQRERNQSIDSRYRNEPLVGEPNRLVKSESNPVCISRKELIIAEPLHPKGFEGLTQSTVDSEPEIQRSSVSGPVIYRKDLSPDSNHTSATTVTPTATRTVTTSVTAISSVLPGSTLSTTTITNMTVTQGLTAAPSEGRSSTASPMLDGKHWGPERTVEVRRDDKNSLGISIVGGKVDLSWSGSSVTGIFIKNVLPDSPAGKGGHLKTGDRILEVEGVDLRGATHEKAVEVIKKTGNPVTFVVQSLVQWTPANSAPPSRDVSRLGTRMPNSISPARTPTPELIQPGLPDHKKQEIQANLHHPLNRRQTTEDSEDEVDDERYEQGRIETKKGVEIDRASAGAIRRSKAEKSADQEEEDEFGYTKKKIAKKYGDLKGEVILVDLQKGANGLGISLAGNKDRTLMSAFICGLNPNGNAFKDGRLRVGDEILEVNGNVIYGRCHLNASSIFKGIPGPTVKVIVLRKKTGLQEMAIKPITQFPVTLEDETPEEKYARFKGLTNIVMKKGSTGLGIMIIEGKHAEYGQGIFISDLQEGSVAAEAGLLVGDIILCVNKEEMVGVDYDQATNILKKTEGVINMWVANPARAGGGDPKKPAAGKKPDVPPKPALGPKPALPAKPPSISSLPPPAATPVTSSTEIQMAPSSPPIPPGRAAPVERLSSHGLASITSTTSSISTASSPSSLVATDEPKQDPATAEIRPGRETTIEIVKEKMGLGLSIVGGSDTLLGAIIIHEVYPDGAAAKDGRLKPGDQILNVNNENFRDITHQKALSVLRQTPSKDKEKVKMVVYREEGSQKEEDLYDIITVQLTKKSGKGLGLSIVGRKNGPGVFISDVVPGGVAESDGRLMQGDQILEVNDKDLRQATQEQAAAILKCAPGSVSMKLGRLKAGKKANSNNNANNTWPVTISDSSPEGSTKVPPEPPVPIPRTHLPPLIQPHHLPPQTPPLQQQQQQIQPKEPQETSGIRTILLERRDDGLGFSIVGGFGSNLGDLPIYVKSVFERGAAAREGSLRRGDQILEVNGESLAGLTHAEAVYILKEARGTVALTILPSK
ncbi:multiple PDZ domain protein isoform X5 [Penaeus vannamei]|uniref:multiple PDZ domain protein isoform X5 n=1 Tax=Penaeus vannamei TaxID=6689 RepID=UPI00387F3BCB